MQISKSLLVVCAVVCCAASISFAGPDSVSQAQAREALRKKIAELKAQEPATETRAVKAPSAEKKGAPVPTFQPVAQEPPATITPAPAPVAPAPTAAVTVPPSTTPITASSPEETARQRAALRQKLAELSAQEKAAPVVKSPEKKSGAVTKATPAEFAPLAPPPSSVPAAKEARLNELLSKYKADDITPEEYHKERAKILAEP